MTDEDGATKGRFDFIIYCQDYRHFCKVSFPIASIENSGNHHQRK
jgi:hypothetical protein